MLITLSAAPLSFVSQESVLDRLERLINEAVRAGRFNSAADFLVQAGLSSGYLAEFRSRLEKNPKASMKLETARVCAGLLGTSISAFTGEDGDDPPVIDVYPGRAWAISAARALKFPEAAIQLILKERPREDPGRMYWFRRLESEAERVRPAALLSGKPVDDSRR